MEQEITPKPEATTEPIKIEVFKGGPMAVFGQLEVKLADGSIVEKGPRTTFCRCGHSANKPFCDGAHKKIDWTE
jgi:CDGSH-type Zn-finger protein